MTTFDGKAFGKEIVKAVKGYVDTEIAKVKANPLQEAFDQGFDAMKAYVDRSLDHYAERIEALEAEKGIKPRVRVAAGSSRDA
ncbi:hypothetical protein [Mesorhizobium sp. CAU 1741]|uniref:hypothetical protein n=1 Tax=Mesorhizobium sp. CAU 1741 TaxID=3140366 RepID=UPI00325A98F5